ncbi:hypothetical protein E1B28_003015 [Marasmius oreades]|uniref:Uncharacterized protein n=1 Tax=Marasmius oreades TaxID=181124 RepID=A0A9P7RK93_9AGAR|nr:uncharacterized protein E1B28_003015 [Marasmius oreades]KAG7085454.1 hypothetical protein E1B28_003015 [Marasmius oreades]
MNSAVGNMLVSGGCECCTFVWPNGDHYCDVVFTETVFCAEGPPPEGYEYWRALSFTKCISVILESIRGATKFSLHCHPVFVPYDEQGGVFQLVLKETPSHQHAVLNTTIDGTPALNTNDLIVRHPDIPELWQVYGRGMTRLCTLLERRFVSKFEKTGPDTANQTCHPLD